jgi:septal ring factor EnvC (AmiA/AmiB activator)
MWPKALAQLIELAPHITRLIPMADRFLQSKSSADEANRAALDQTTAGMRSDLQTAVGQITSSHAGIYRQLNEQGERIAELNANTRSMHASVEALESHLQRTERALRLQSVLLVAAIVLLLTLILIVLLRTH